MKEYEYKTITFKRYANAFYGHQHMMEIHKLGLQGWELHKNTESSFTFRRSVYEKV